MCNLNNRESKNAAKEEPVKENGEDSPVKDAVTKAVEEAEEAEKIESMETDPVET